jgi:hypothetical protein
MSEIVAVFTGDFVGSSRLTADELNAAFSLVGDAIGSIAQWRDPRLPHLGRRNLRFTRYRGDGWQAMLEHAWLAPRAALTIHAHLLAHVPDITTRISIGLGTTGPLPDYDLGAATGEAFEHSGRNLDRLVAQQKAGSQKLRRVRVTIAGTGITPFHAASVTLLDAFTRRWTKAQAEIMDYALHPGRMPLAQIANQHLFISPQAAGARIQSLGYWEIQTALDAWETWYMAVCGVEPTP